MKMTNKVRTSARRKASRPVSDTVRMVVMKGATLKDLADVKLPPDAEVAIISSSPHGVKEIKAAIRTGKSTKSSGPRMHWGFVAGYGIRVRVRSPKVKPVGTALVNRAAFEPDARSRAILEGVRIAQRDLENAGGAYDLEQVRTLLRGISRQAIDKRVQEGALLAVPGPSNHRRYPTLQFNRDGSIVAGLKEVREALPVESAWAVLNFLTDPDDRLDGRKPIDLLRAGNVAQVVEAARLYGEPGG